MNEERQAVGLNLSSNQLHHIWMVKSFMEERDAKYRSKLWATNQNTASFQTEAVANTAHLDMFKDVDVTISSSAHSSRKKGRSVTITVFF